MAKKRKLSTKSTDATTTSTQQQPKKIQKKNQQQQQQNEQQQQEEEEAKEQQLQQLQQEEMNQEEEEVEEEEEEIEEIEEEFEVEGDEGDEEEDEEETKRNDVVVEEADDEPISNLLEPFTKDQLIMILREAAETHPDVASRIRKVADEDTVHRKIFVHGLGWDTTEDTLRSAFSQYGEIEDCKAVMDKISGKSKGYGFILFKTRGGARKALEVPMKKIGNRMTSCQLSAVGSVPAPGGGGVAQPVGPVSEYTQRKIYVSNVSADIDPQKLMAFFAKFGEIEDGPLGLDKQTGKPKGFCLFVYRSVESAKKALAEPHKHFEGHLLHCQKAIDGPKPGKQQMGGQSRGKHFGGRGDKSGAMGGGPATGGGLMGQLVGATAAPAPAPALNPALGQALTALLASQGAGLGLNNLLGTLGGGVAGVPGGGAAAHGAYGAQSVGYGTQGGLQSAYPNQQMGQGGSGRSSHGMGGVPPYGGR